MNSITLNPETGIMSIKDMKVGTIFLISDCIYMRLDRRDPMNDKIACAGLRSGGLLQKSPVCSILQSKFPLHRANCRVLSENRIGLSF